MEPEDIRVIYSGEIQYLCAVTPKVRSQRNSFDIDFKYRVPRKLNLSVGGFPLYGSCGKDGVVYQQETGHLYEFYQGGI
ncbi:MAG: hypothetical protein BWY89_01123 [Bacteroidetes bacterium ADurb.BinA012]|nr:MAG: hypothetical protein BWY89_01123 [Bacteroidetes bacterium ADurb.BinA012]